MTGRPGDRTMEMNGGSIASYLARTPRSESKGAFRLPGATWDHFRCTVEPSPGHIWCRILPEASPLLEQPLFAVPALRELESACRVSICEMLSQYPQSAFRGSPRVAGGVSSSLRPKPSASICSV